MSTHIENTLWKNPSVYVTEDQLAHLLNGTPDSRYAHINRAVKDGHLIRIKRGLFYLGERLSSRGPSSFELAQFIYGPSYISLESALSYHRLIPEAVYTTTSVAIKRNKKFETPLGVFSYCRLPTDNFFAGVEHVKTDDYQFFVASPWKAILDYIYCYKHDWVSVEPLDGSLRIELEDLPKIDNQLLEQLKVFYHSRRIDRFIKNIPLEFISEH